MADPVGRVHPSGGIWIDETIRGFARHGTGLLRNRLYVGEMVWNRLRTMKDPNTETRHLKARDPDALVVHAMPDLRIVPQDLWERAQARIATGQAKREAGPARNRFWEHRRPRQLLTRKVFCGSCGGHFMNLGRDYLGCFRAHQGACGNEKRVRRGFSQKHVLEVLGHRLMDPDLTAAFVTAFAAEWNRLIAEHGAGGETKRRELQAVERKIAKLVDAICEGIRSADMQSRLTALEARRMQLRGDLRQEIGPPPALHPNLAASSIGTRWLTCAMPCRGPTAPRRWKRHAN